ncbi:MAG: 30S ribosomal protein S9 [Anaerolineales bacterium]|nr:30S ribosomal protein S9 [Anaerolineales bacterium]
MTDRYYEGIGRRKASSARVRLHPGGDGSVIINDKPAAEYLNRFGDLQLALAPLETTGTVAKFNVTIKVNGGGVTGQTEAIQLGVARALLEWDENLRSALRRGGFLTRDPRVKERKKPGLKRARKAPTYTKR